MPTRTWYFRQGFLDYENLYPGLDYGQGWTVDKKGATNYARLLNDQVVASTAFTTSVPANLSSDLWRTTYGCGGWKSPEGVGITYDAGNWVIAYKVRCNSYYAQTGYLAARFYLLDYATYTQYTPISDWVYSSLISFTAANQYKTGTITWTMSSPMHIDYLEYMILVDLMWVTAASGGNNAAIVYFCEGEASGETLTSPEYTLDGAGTTWTYAGEVPAALTPESTLKLVKRYSTGELPASLLPESALKLIKAYAGEVQASLAPEHGIQVTLCPLTEAPFSFGLEGVYQFVLPAGIFVYGGEVPLGILPEHTVSALYSPPPGEVGISMAADHAVKLLWHPASEVQASLAPEHQIKAIMVPAVELHVGLTPECIVSRLWASPAAGLPLSAVPEHAESFIRTFAGEIPLVAALEGTYSRRWDAGAGLIALSTSLEGVIKLIRAYSGEVQTGLFPEHNESVTRSHKGEVAILLTPEHQFGRIAVFIGGLAFDLAMMGLSTFQLLGRSELELSLFSWVEEAHYSFTPVRLYKGPYGVLVHCPFTSVMSLIPSIRAAAKEGDAPSGTAARMDDPHGELIHNSFTSVMASDPSIRAAMMKKQHDAQGE